LEHLTRDRPGQESTKPIQGLLSLTAGLGAAGPVDAGAGLLQSASVARCTRRIATLILAAYACTGSIPCLEGADAITRAAPGIESEHGAHADIAHRDRAVAARCAGHQAEPYELRAPCPCGCCALPDADGAVARAGYALLSAPPDLTLCDAERADANPVQQASSAHRAPLDHVPLHS